MDVYDFPFGYRSLGMNGHRSAAGLLIPANEADTIRVNAFDFSRLQMRDQREPLNLLVGGDLGDVSPAFRYLSLSGMIRASTGMALDDKIAELIQAFNPDEAALAGGSGLSAFTFTGTTLIDTGRGTAFTDPVLGTAGFYVPEQFLARPAAWPVVRGARSGGLSATFAAELVCADPRRYIQTAEAVALTAGNGFSASCPNWTSAQGWSVPPVVTIVTTASGSATFGLDIAGDGLTALILDLSAVGAATIVVDCATGTIKIGTTYRADLRVSTADTLFAKVPRGGGVATATNTTSVSSVTLAYRQARG